MKEMIAAFRCHENERVLCNKSGFRGKSEFSVVNVLYKIQLLLQTVAIYFDSRFYEKQSPNTVPFVNSWFLNHIYFTENYFFTLISKL